MATGTSILMKEMTYTRSKIEVLKKALKHHLRIEFTEKNINYNFSKSGENVISVKDTLTDEIGANLSNEDKEKLLKQLEKMLIQDKKKNKIDPKILLSVKRDFKRFLASDIKAIDKPSKREEQDFTLEQRTRRKELTQKILNNIENGLKGNVLDDMELEEYSNLVKPNRIERINLLQGKTQDKVQDTTIQAFESFFKIPIDNDIDLSAKESKIINEDFYKTYFPNYDLIASFEHNDEEVEKIDVKGNVLTTKRGGNHTHNIISAKNKETGEFDYTKQKRELIKEQLLKEFSTLETREDFSKWYFDSYFELTNIPEDFLNLKTTEEKIEYIIGTPTKSQTPIQQIRFGAIYQNIVFDFVNNHQIFKDRDLKAEKFINMGNTREEIFENKRRLSAEDKNHLNKDVFNGYEITKENTKKTEEYIKILEDKNNKLEKQIEENETLYNEIKEEAIKEANEENTKLIEQNKTLREDIKLIEQEKEDASDSLVAYKELIDKEQDNYATEKREEINKELKPLKNELIYARQEREEIIDFKKDPINKLALDFIRDDENNPLFEKFKELRVNQKEFSAFKEHFKITDDIEYWGNLLEEDKKEIKEEARKQISNQLNEINKEETQKLTDKHLDLTEKNKSLLTENFSKLTENRNLKKEIDTNTIMLNKQKKYVQKLQYIEQMKINLSKEDNLIFRKHLGEIEKDPEKLEVILLEYINFNNNFDEMVKEKNNKLNELITKNQQKETNIYKDFIKDFGIKEEDFPDFESLKNHFINIHKTRFSTMAKRAEVEAKNALLETEKTELENKIFLQNNQNKELLGEKIKYENKSNRLETENQELTKKLDTSNKTLEFWKNSYKTKEKENIELKSTINNMVDAINDLRDRIPELKTYIKDKVVEAKDFIKSIGNMFKSKNKHR